MKFARAAFAATLFSTYVIAFQPLQQRQSAVQRKSPSQLFSSVAEETATSAPCATPDIIPEAVTAAALRSATLTDANGQFARLGEKMGKGTSIVVFLRHLG